MSSPTYPGPRLEALYQQVLNAQQEKRYTCIWDCCCDHGFLGIKILSEALCDQLVFVDSVASIMAQLAARLRPFPPDRYVLLTQDAGTLPFHPDQQHLVIVAGLGGEQIVDIVRAIKAAHGCHPADYLFCPANSAYQLREYLHTEQLHTKTLHLEAEGITIDNNRLYEFIYVRRTPAAGATAGPAHINPVSLTGQLWDMENPLHLHHLRKLIRHHRNRSLRDSSGKSLQIQQAYEACLGTDK